MDKNNLNKFVDEALKKKDFKKINDLLSQTINTSIDIARGAISTFSNAIGRKNNDYIPAKDPELVMPNPGFTKKAFIARFIGYIASFVFLVSGIGNFLDNNIIAGIFLFLPGIITGYGSYSYGKSQIQKNIRLNRYIRELKKDTVISLNDLATAVNMDVPFVARELKNFIKEDIFREGRVVENDSIFILDNKTYKLYKERAYEAGYDLYDGVSESYDDTKQNIDDSEVYLKQLRRLQADLDEPVKSKVKVLNSIVERIFAYAKKNPESLETSYRFMSYYLPTVIKLLDSYREYESIEFEGENIKSAMFDIEMSMDTINSAFEKFIDDLYESDTFDVKADLNVMKTVMSRDGLIKNNRE